MLTQEEYQKKLEKIRKKNDSKKLAQKLEKEKNKYKEKRKPLSASKQILLGAVILCLQIITFCEYMMWKTNDLQAMYVLIGIASSLTMVVLGYFFKSKAENTSGGIVYDTAMENLRQLGQNMCDLSTEESNDEAHG